jgi:hypothetical protein
VALIELTGGEIRLAKLQEYAGDRRAAKCVQRAEQKGRGNPFATEIPMDGNVEDFGFVGDLASGHEGDYLILGFAHEKKAAG